MSFLSCLIWLGPKHRLCSRSFPANISWILNASEPYYHLRGWEVRYIRLLDLWPHSHSAIMLLSPPQPSGAKSPTGLGSSTLGLKSRQSPFANQEFSEEVRISERERGSTQKETLAWAYSCLHWGASKAWLLCSGHQGILNSAFQVHSEPQIWLQSALWPSLALL